MIDIKSESSRRTGNTVDSKRLLRLPEVLHRIPISRSSWYEGIKSGKYPQPVRLGPRTVAWKETDIDKLCEGE